MFKADPTDVKMLRDRTGVGMMECKNALTEANGNMDKAIEYLREKGLAAAAKKAGRIAADGLVNAYVADKKNVGALLEMNCETDFVAMNADFKKFVQDITELIAIENPINVSVLSELRMADGRAVKEVLTENIQIFGEKINIRRFARYEVNGVGIIHSYIHSDLLTQGKVGVILECSADNIAITNSPEFASLMNDLVLQITAYKPDYVRKEDIPADIIKHEKDIYLARAMNEGKPQAIAEKIMQGRVEKFYREVCLLEQPYLRDESKTISDMIQDINSKLDAKCISVVRFTRYEKGEGIDKN